ncbi:hypothetical protein NC653_037742 [Populus alba x Populus x berolinensis]|uniref:Uncharacterized protein n=1 Tax=Populus alba x Populus x berolinensis TaxID=444605 RepID=A0AAD6LF06_9ROSI|nr:hypothetical protein NC653_037742 [Populus alba x Populus x berolinensis]
MNVDLRSEGRSRRPAWTKKMKGMETVAVAFSGGEWRRMA